jgi:hypothetical protein
VPTGSFDYSSQGTQLAMDAIPVGVFQYFPVSKEYELFPNVRCEQIQYKEGAEPPTARFSYIFDDLAANANGWPNQFEQVWPLNTKPGYLSYTVTPSTELAVLCLLPDGSTRVLFDGFPRVPQTDVTPESQHVTFTAVGVAVRCWDKPIGGRIQRSGDDLHGDLGLSSDIQTDLPVRFNPAGTGARAVGGILPNCTPDGYDVEVAYAAKDGDPNSPYPVFLDPAIDRDPDERTFWNLSKAVRYILATQNIVKNEAGDPWVKQPAFDALDDLLQNRRPLDGEDFFDPDDPSTYKTDPNIIRDYDATNKTWPEVLGQLLGFYGFAYRFVCRTGTNGQPSNRLEVYRKDAAGPTKPKTVHLPPGGSNLPDVIADLAAFHAGFDFHGVANDIFVESHIDRYEISVVLAPGFVPQTGDGATAVRTTFTNAALALAAATEGDRAAYRVYIADECGDNHWSVDGQTVVDTPVDFTPVLHDDNGKADYVKRYRPGKNTLLSKDANNKPRKARLSVSTDYTGTEGPCIWDGTDNWQDISPGVWELLPDRLGIKFTCDDPYDIHIGKPPAGHLNGGDWPYPDGKMNGITGMCDPADKPHERQFFLRLTTVIEGDFGIGAFAARRGASPLGQTIQRRVDASDHFYLDTIHASSDFNTSTQSPKQDYTVQDDTQRAVDHAVQLRSAHEFPPLTAALTIPFLSRRLHVGDRVKSINGRDVSLLVNAGAEQGEPASYPYVVAVTWDFQGEKQSTTIQLSDRRQEPRRPVA